MVIEVREEQSPNMRHGIVVNELGISTDINDEHSSKQKSPQLVSFFGRVIDTSAEQSRNVASPKDSIDLGSLMFVRARQVQTE